MAKREPKPNYYNSAYHKALYDVFLTYSNNSFQEDPQNILLFYKAIKTFHAELFQQFNEYLNEEAVSLGLDIGLPGQTPIELEGIIQEIVRQSNKHRTLAIADYNRFHKLLEGPGAGPEFSPYFDIAFDAVWGGDYFRDCDECWYNDQRDNKKKLRCHECDQEAFIKLLNDALPGEKNVLMYSDLFNELIILRNRFSKSYVFLSRENGVDLLNETAVFHAEDYFRINNFHPDNYLFSRFVWAILGFSFISFLQNYETIKNLKKCPYCGDFFIAKDRKRTFCYDNHECQKAEWRSNAQTLMEKNPHARLGIKKD